MPAHCVLRSIGRLRGQAVKTQRREQAEDAGRHTDGDLGERVFRRRGVSGRHVDATRSPLDEELEVGVAVRVAAATEAHEPQMLACTMPRTSMRSSCAL